jgi:hypothetical protein
MVILPCWLDVVRVIAIVSQTQMQAFVKGYRIFSFADFTNHVAFLILLGKVFQFIN